ncbi:hypothetical protein [Helicobacter fennelliae]|uniref:hypothetical protein n=1 Tax=Helicobacter fennelliae TaxID=215 RepID=UPI000E1987A0|nr:hypothetical protein [Helicobacter fennelliae]STP14490.1 lipase family protein [Helicobacter fennelliae]
MSEKSSIVKHIDDLADGVWDSVVVTAYGFSEFLYKVSGLKDFIFDSGNKEQQEAIEEFKVFVDSLKLIKDNSTIRDMVIDQIIQDAKDRPLYYAGSLIGPSAIASLIKNAGARVAYSSGVFVQKGFNASNKYIYPNYKTLQNNICSLYSNDKNYTNLFNQDMIMCSFSQNENPESKTQSLQQEMQRLYHNIQKTNTEFNAYKPIPIISFTNPKVAYIQKLNPKDIHSLTPNSPLHLLKALFFCENYILLDSNKEPLLRESNWREFYNYKSDFYTIFIADKQALTQDYINERISLYNAIMQIRKQIQDKEIQELQKQQQELEQQLQGLDSKERESKLQEYQREQERKQRDKERQAQRQVRFSKGNTTSTTQNLNTNNNAYITKDSYLILESNDRDTKIIFLDSLKDSHIRTFSNPQANANTSTNSLDSNNSYLANTSLSFANLIFQHNNKVSIFARDNSIIDSKQIEQDFSIDVSNMPCDVYFYALLLRGGKEDIDNPRFFYGEKGEVYMSDESDNIEIFYNNARVSMTNYYYHAYS